MTNTDKYEECEECGFSIDPDNEAHPVGTECICDLKAQLVLADGSTPDGRWATTEELIAEVDYLRKLLCIAEANISRKDWGYYIKDVIEMEGSR